jgi:PAS domain S-box-containing protein
MSVSLAGNAIKLTEITLLHVDDDPVFAELASTFLERQDDRFTVETASSADAGLERLGDGEIDCIVSDYDMPKTDGIEFLEVVRGDFPDLPFILYTGKGSETVASEAFSAGATDYLQKERGTDQYTLLANKVTNYVEKYRAEREMRRRAQAMQTADEGIALLDDDGRYVTLNEAYADICATTADEMVGAHWTTTVAGDEEVERLRREAFSSLSDGRSWTGETIGCREDGGTFPKRLSLAALDSGGHVCVVRDITEQKAHERNLDRARRKFRKLFTHANDAIFIVDPIRETFVDCNPAAADLLGLSRDCVLTDRSPADIHPDESGAALRDFFERVLDQGTGWTDDAPLVTADGRTRTVEMSAGSIEIDGRSCIVNVARDVTDRNRRARELRRYERMVNTMREAVAVYDTDGRFEAVNESLASFYDTTPDALEGEESLLVDRIRAEADDDPFRALLDGERDELRGEIDGDFPERGYALLDYRLTPMTVDGTIAGAVGVARPVTDRKQRERQLRRYERIVEASGDPVYTLDPDGRFTFVNDRLVERLGYDRDELLGEHVSLLMNDDDVETGRQLIQSLLAGSDDRGMFEMDVVAADGETITCENHVALVRSDGDFEGTVGIVRDITDRKRRETVLKRKNDRLERFTSLVSHDLRNPLNVAQGCLELAQDGEDGYVDDAAHALDRCQRLVDDLLLLAHEGDGIDDSEAVSLGDVVENCWRHVETGDARLVVDAESTVVADQSRLKQLLENLIRNAVEHGSTNPRSQVPEDTVEHGTTDGRRGTSRRSGPDGERVTVTVGDLSGGFYVEDDGPGIPTAERGRVFDSGYSTTVDGTGFGLSIVREIAETHGWTVAIVDGDDGGARIEFTDVERTDET